MAWMESLDARRLFAVGSLDATFGDDGHAPMSDETPRLGRRVLEMSDGRIVVADGGWGLRRYLPDGSIDPSFGGGDGRATPVDGLMSQIFGVSLLSEAPDGGLFIGGDAALSIEDLPNIVDRRLVAKVRRDGSLDTGFLSDSDSNVHRAGFFRVGHGQMTGVRGGKLLVATNGVAETGPRMPVQFTRYKSNGFVDKSFGTGGRIFDVPLPIPTETITAPGKRPFSFRFATGITSLVEAPDGSAVAAGYHVYASDTESSDDAIPYTPAYLPYLLRISATGQIVQTKVFELDLNKGQSSRYSGFSVPVNLIDIGGDGKIYLAGGGMVARLNPDFSLDTTFSVDGMTTATGPDLSPPYVGLPGALLADLEVQADGKLLAVVLDAAIPSNTRDPLLIRFRGDGTLEPVVKLAVPPNAPPPFGLDRSLNSVELSADGTILVAGGTMPLARVFRDEAPAGRFEGGSIRTSGQGGYKFGVIFRDDDGVALESIDNSDLQILTPTGRRLAARVISKTARADGAVEVRYRAGPPDCVTWTSADNGEYIVRLLSNRIADVTGALAAGRTLGSFAVQVPTPIMTTSTTAVAMDLGRGRSRLAPNT